MPFKICHHSMFLESTELELGKSKLTHKWGVLKYHKVFKTGLQFLEYRSLQSVITCIGDSTSTTEFFYWMMWILYLEENLASSLNPTSTNMEIKILK